MTEIERELFLKMAQAIGTLMEKVCGVGVGGAYMGEIDALITKVRKERTNDSEHGFDSHGRPLRPRGM